jgi:hypothetical protein
MDANTTFTGDVQILGKLYGGSPVKIAGGLDVISGNSNFGDIFVNSCDGCGVFTYNGTANYTGINASNITAVNLVVTGTATFVNPPFNESGISRNYSLILNTPMNAVNVPVPMNREVTMTAFINGTSQPSSIMMTFNDDMANNYMYRRIQGYTFLYQAITASPRTNITMEGYTSNGQRQIEIKITKLNNGVVGSYRISTGDNLSSTPYSTLGNFEWINSDAVNVTLMSSVGNINSGSYIIVKSEGL